MATPFFLSRSSIRSLILLITTPKAKFNRESIIFQDDDVDGGDEDSEVAVDAGAGAASLLWEDDDMKNFYENLCESIFKQFFISKESILLDDSRDVTLFFLLLGI